MKAVCPTREHPKREVFWIIKATGWPKKRRIYPTVVRTIVMSYGELARVVLWLETMGYHCRISRHKI